MFYMFCHVFSQSVAEPRFTYIDMYVWITIYHDHEHLRDLSPLGPGLLMTWSGTEEVPPLPGALALPLSLPRSAVNSLGCQGCDPTDLLGCVL